jgi:hypothetical protein
VIAKNKKLFPCPFLKTNYLSLMSTASLKKMKSYIIILAEILLVIIFASAMPIALYAGGQNELALYSTYVFGAIILWFSIVMIHLEYISRKVGKED